MSKNIIQRRRIVEIERECRLRRQRYAPTYQPRSPFEVYMWHEKKLLTF